MAWLKYTLLGLLVVLLVAALGGYLVLRNMGVIPRRDYDSVAPSLPGLNPPAILVLNKTNGFIHTEAIPAAQAMFTAIAAERGWDIVITDNAASHNARDLEKFQLVVWNNVSGDVLTPDQRTALREWIEAGGGWLGVHAAGGDLNYDWRWYVETLVGAQFVGHTIEPQFQDASVAAIDPDMAITAHIQNPWRVAAEEWYAFVDNPRYKGYEIVLTIDENSYSTQGKGFFWTDNMIGEHPIAWRHRVGEGRAFYSAIGHQAATYDLPVYRQFLSGAMRWTMSE